MDLSISTTRRDSHRVIVWFLAWMHSVGLFIHSIYSPYITILSFNGSCFIESWPSHIMFYALFWAAIGTHIFTYNFNCVRLIVPVFSCELFTHTRMYFKFIRLYSYCWYKGFNAVCYNWKIHYVSLIPKYWMHWPLHFILNFLGLYTSQRMLLLHIWHCTKELRRQHDICWRPRISMKYLEKTFDNLEYIGIHETSKIVKDMTALKKLHCSWSNTLMYLEKIFNTKQKLL